MKKLFEKWWKAYQGKTFDAHLGEAAKRVAWASWKASRKKLAVVAILMLAASSSRAQVQTVTNTYGTYTTTQTVSYDPNMGALGTLYITLHLSGQPRPNMPPNINHTPTLTYMMNGSGYSQPCPAYPAGQSPNCSRTWAFDLETVCGIDELLAGTCSGEPRTQIWCPVMSQFFVDMNGGGYGSGDLVKWITFTSMKANSTSDLHATEFCNDRSTPADNPGYSPVPSYGTGVWRQKGLCWTWTGGQTIACGAQALSQVQIQADTRIDCTKFFSYIRPSN